MIECTATLLSNKSPGVDNVSVELLKEGAEPVVRWLTSLIQQMVNEEPIPED